jgi:serine/threonine protein phosphatase PrpC
MAEKSRRRWTKRPRSRKNNAGDAGALAPRDAPGRAPVDIPSDHGGPNGEHVLDYGLSIQGPPESSVPWNKPANGGLGPSDWDANDGASYWEDSVLEEVDTRGAVPGGAPQPAVSQVKGPIWVPQLVIGSASPDVETVPIDDAFRSVPFRPDTVIDGWSHDSVAVLGTSIRGHFHRYNGAPRQDDFAAHLMPDGRIIAVVADGVSAATQSHFGSTTVVNYAAQWLLSQMPACTEQTDWKTLVRSTAWALAERAQVLFGTEAPDPGLAERELATTMTCAVVEPSPSGALRAFVIGIGDSGAWLLRQGEFHALLGGKAVTEGGISSSAVSALPRVPTVIEPSVAEVEPGDVLLIGTDGIGDPLGGGEGGVGNLFRELFGNQAPPSLIEFAHAVDFSRETFDDDRTLVAVYPWKSRRERRELPDSQSAEGWESNNSNAKA